MVPHTRYGQPSNTMPDIRGTAAPALSLAEPPPSPHMLTLLARPDIAALIEQVRSLTARQHAALAERFGANHHLHSLDQVRICHRVSLAAADDHPHHAAVRALVWRIAARTPGGRYAAAVAASDMVFVLLSGNLLSADERALFDAPWRAVVGEPPAAPWVSIHDSRTGDHTFARVERAALALLAADPIGASRADDRMAA